MELMIEADNVVRRLIPAVLESTGEEEEARRLRDHSKLNARTAKSICRLLSTVNIYGSMRHLIFWTEALVRAAVRKDPVAFAFYINKVTYMLATSIYNKQYLN
jgi:hypothetical protein